MTRPEESNKHQINPHGFVNDIILMLTGVTDSCREGLLNSAVCTFDVEHHLCLTHNSVERSPGCVPTPIKHLCFPHTVKRSHIQTYHLPTLHRDLNREARSQDTQRLVQTSLHVSAQCVYNPSTYVSLYCNVCSLAHLCHQ